MKFNKRKASRAVAYLLSAVMVSQALLSPVSMVYANGDDDSSQQQAVQVENTNGNGEASNKDAAAGQGASDDTAAVTEASSTDASAKQGSSEAAASTQAAGSATAQGSAATQDAVATQASGYNPNAEPIKLGDGSHSSISAGVYKDADLKNPISSDEKLSTDQQLYGQIKIKFASDERPTLEHPNIAYDLPSNVEVKNQGPFTLYDGTKEAGTWEIKDGVAYLHYNESYLAATVTEAHLKFDFTVKDKNKGDGQKPISNSPVYRRR